MARIRIVDEWLRSPVSGPSRFRAVMVVAESWSEQRVLMRAFAASPDQTRPTINLHGAELAIGPAGTDPHGSWGIHVEPPADGRAQELRAQLELAARRLAGSKGNPPRLVDEASRFESKPTGNWAPGTPRDPPPDPRSVNGPASLAGGKTRMGFDYYEPVAVAPPSPSPPLPSYPPPPGLPISAIPTQALEPVIGSGFTPLPGPAYGAAVSIALADHQGVPPSQALASAPPSQQLQAMAPSQALPTTPATRALEPELFALTPARAPVGEVAANPAFRGATPRRKSRPRSAQRAAAPSAPPFDGHKTQPGFSPAQTIGPGMVSARPPMPLTAPRAPTDGGLAKVVGKTMPLGFRLEPAERAVLNALGKAAEMSASEIAGLAEVADGVSWMEGLMVRLSGQGLDLVVPGRARGGEPTYRLKR